MDRHLPDLGPVHASLLGILCAGAIRFEVHDKPVDVREEAESGEAKSHESQGADVTYSHVVLPIFSRLFGVVQFDLDASVRLDKTIAFAEVDNVELLLEHDQQVVDAGRDLVAELGEVTLRALFREAEAADERDGDVSYVDVQGGEGGPVGHRTVLAAAFRTKIVQTVHRREDHLGLRALRRHIY